MLSSLSFRRLGPCAAALLAFAGCDRHPAATAPEAAPADGPSMAVASSSRTSLGTLGGTSSTAYDINVHGHVVGTSTLGDGSRRAFLWKPGTGMTPLPAGTTHAYGINDAGQVVGRGVFGGAVRGFVWTPSTGTLKQLPLGVASSSTGEARDINNAGQVVGFSNVGTTPKPVLWTPDASQASGYRVTALGTFGGSSGEAHGINDHGTVAGWATFSSGEKHPFRWMPTAANAPTGSMELLEDAYFEGGAAYDINAAGQISGYVGRFGRRLLSVWDPFATQPRHWRAPGADYDESGEAFAIDGSGDAVGIYDGRARIFPDGGDMQVLAGPGASPSAAYGIAGDKVVGQIAGVATLWTSVVTNAPPVAVAGGPYLVEPGDTIVLDATGSTDPDGDPLTYRWIPFGNNPVSGPAYAFSRQTIGYYYFDLIVRDDDGREDTVRSVKVTVNTVPTAVIANGPAVSGTEGSPIYLNGTPSGDPDGQTLTYAWTFGDGTTSDGDDHHKTYRDNGVYSVRLIVADSLGGRDTASATVTVANVAPTAVFDQTPGLEGTPRPLSLSGVTEPSTVDRESLQYAFDCGSGYGDWGSEASTTCPAVPDQDTVPVRAKVRDKDGGESEYARNQNVVNVLPVVSATASSTSVRVGDLVTVAGSFADPGADAPWTWTYEWGDGTSSRGGTSGFTLPPSGHRYTAPGTYTLRILVRDDRGFGRAAPVTITVSP